MAGTGTAIRVLGTIIDAGVDDSSGLESRARPLSTSRVGTACGDTGASVASKQLVVRPGSPGFLPAPRANQGGALEVDRRAIAKALPNSPFADAPLITKVRGGKPIADPDAKVACGTAASAGQSTVTLRPRDALPQSQFVPQNSATILLPGFALPRSQDGDVMSGLYDAVRGFQRCPPTLLIAVTDKGNIQVVQSRGKYSEILPPSTGSTGSSCELQFRYRTETFTVPCDWFYGYMSDWLKIYGEDHDASHGKISSWSDALDGVWTKFRGNITERAAYEEILGCYNLHRDEGAGDHTYMFWTDGWGAPLQFHRFMCQMALTYTHFAVLKDDYSIVAAGGEDPCAGLANFIFDAMTNEPVEVSYFGSKIECTVRIDYQNVDDRYARVNNSCVDFGKDCNVNFYGDSCRGLNWDTLTIHWDHVFACWSGDNAAGGAPRGRCDTALAYVDPESARADVTFEPLVLGYNAAVCDRILFLARMCYDQGRHRAHTGEASDDWFETAGRIGRYALSIIADQSGYLVHELGHSITPGFDHCGAECCMSAAAAKWSCKVSAFLGLVTHIYAYYGVDSDLAGSDYGSTHVWVGGTCAQCGLDGKVYHSMSGWCYIPVEGDPGQDGTYFGTGCREECL